MGLITASLVFPMYSNCTDVAAGEGLTAAGNVRERLAPRHIRADSAAAATGAERHEFRQDFVSYEAHRPSEMCGADCRGWYTLACQSAANQRAIPGRRVLSSRSPAFA
ncbi:MAG TPA: hypothetical protein VHS97_21275, partial [Isosphaeraceae bacterium]|nr:hypothetical protein [Isosphaeraceae bacterium]